MNNGSRRARYLGDKSRSHHVERLVGEVGTAAREDDHFTFVPDKKPEVEPLTFDKVDRIYCYENELEFLDERTSS